MRPQPPDPPPLELTVVVEPIDERPPALPLVVPKADVALLVCVAAAVAALVFAGLTWWALGTG